MKVRLSEAAHADLDDIFLAAAVNAPIAAERLIHRLLDAAEGLADFPERGRSAKNGRRELVTVTPYVIVYVVEGSTVSIERIVHGARRR